MPREVPGIQPEQFLTGAKTFALQRNVFPDKKREKSSNWMNESGFHDIERGKNCMYNNDDEAFEEVLEQIRQDRGAKKLIARAAQEGDFGTAAQTISNILGSSRQQQVRNFYDLVQRVMDWYKDS